MRQAAFLLGFLATALALACSGSKATTTVTLYGESTPVIVPTSSAGPTTLVAVATSKSSSTSSSSAAAAAGTFTTSSSTSTDSSSKSGEATFYGGNTSGGTCSFTTYTLPSGFYGTAFSGTSWDASECGACLQVTGPNGNSIHVMVVDECPECEDGHLDLFQDAFAEIGDISAGIIDISYTAISCGITSPLVLHNKSGTSASWFSMQVVNANEPVASLEVSTDGGSTWQSTTRQSYNFFEQSSGFGTSTVDVKVTSANGDSITVSGVAVSSDAQTTASSNF